MGFVPGNTAVVCFLPEQVSICRVRFLQIETESVQPAGSVHRLRLILYAVIAVGIAYFRTWYILIKGICLFLV